MLPYIIRRIIYMIPLLLGISVISFGVMQLAPGDFLSHMALNPEISTETIELLRHQFGLDQPVPVQYLHWLKNAVQFNFGRSFTWNAPVGHIIASHVLNTLLLAFSSMLFAWLLAIPIGIHAAVRQYSLSDKLLTTFAFLGLSIPNWFLALLLLFLIVRTGIAIPIGGAVTMPDYEWMTLSERIVDRLKHLLLPTVVLGTGTMARLMRYMRGNLLEILRQDYVTTARSKGLQERVVIYKHAVRNAINPLITLFGMDLGNLLSGAALTEIIIGWPGMGQLMLKAVTGLDYYLAMGGLVIGGVLLVVGNLIADILLALSDPRIRYQ